MSRGAKRSRSYLYEKHDELFEAAGHDLSKVRDIYARASLATDERYRATGGQVDDCIDLVLEAGCIPGMIHVDDTLSAWKKGVYRQAFENFMLRLESGQTGGAALWNVSRFSRRPKDGERIIDAVEANPKLVIMDAEGVRNLNSAKGRKEFRDELSAAAYYSDQLSANVKRGKRKKVREGEWNVSIRPFGFNLDMTPVPHEAALVRTLSARFLAGESQDKLIGELNKAGVTTTRNKPWCRSALRALLSRPINAGIIEHKESGTTSRIPGEPIVTEEQLHEVVARYAARKRGRPSYHLCTPWMLCQCGAKMYGKSVRYGADRLPNGTRPLYHCNKSWGGCGAVIDGRQTDKAIRALVIEILSDERHADAIAADEAAIDQKLKQMKDRLAELTKTEVGLRRRLDDEDLVYDQWEALTKNLYPKITALQAQIAELQVAAPAPVNKAASASEWATLWDDAATLDERRNLIDMALGDDAIIIAPAVERHRFERDRITVGRPTIRKAPAKAAKQS